MGDNFNRIQLFNYCNLWKKKKKHKQNLGNLGTCQGEKNKIKDMKNKTL